MPGFAATSPVARREAQTMARAGYNPVQAHNRYQANQRTQAFLPGALANLQESQIARVPQPGTIATQPGRQGPAGAYNPNAAGGQTMGPNAPQRVLDQRARLSQMYGPNVTTAQQAIEARKQQVSDRAARRGQHPLSSVGFQQFAGQQSGEIEEPPEDFSAASMAVVQAFRKRGRLPDELDDETLGAIAPYARPNEMRLLLESLRHDDATDKPQDFSIDDLWEFVEPEVQDNWDEQSFDNQIAAYGRAAGKLKMLRDTVHQAQSAKAAQQPQAPQAQPEANAPQRPSGMPQSQLGYSVQEINTPEEYAALPKGAQYIARGDPQQIVRVKR